MPSQELPKTERISKSHGRMMIAVGLFFDLLPIILVLITVGIVIYSIGGSGVGDIQKANEIADEIADKESLYKDMGAFGYTTAGAAAGYEGGKGAFKLATGGIAGILTAFVLGPLLYTIGSFFSVVVGYLLFTFWFLLKGVNMWSFNSAQRVLVNMASLVIEAVPGLNLLPGITIMVWRHVKVSQAEDIIKNKLEEGEVGKQIARLANMQA